MKVTFVLGDDWTGLYIDDELVIENHSLSAGQVLKAIGVEFNTIVADEDWLEEHGSLPDALKDVKKTK